MPIVVRCACGKEYHFKDEYAGRRAKCPACGQVVRIPGARPAGRPSPHSPLREDRRSRTRELALLGSAGFVVLVGIGLVVYFLFFSGPAPRTARPAAPSPATQQPSAPASEGPAPASGPSAPVEPSAPSPATQPPSAAASEGPAPASGPPAPAAGPASAPAPSPTAEPVPPPPPAPPKTANDDYTPSAVLYLLTKDSKFVSPNLQEGVGRLQQTVESAGQADTIVFPKLCPLTLEVVQAKLGKEDRQTTEALPGISGGLSGRPLSGPCFWYGRVGLVFLIAGSREEPSIEWTGLRYVPKTAKDAGKATTSSDQAASAGAAIGAKPAKPLSASAGPASVPSAATFEKGLPYFIADAGKDEPVLGDDQAFFWSRAITFQRNPTSQGIKAIVATSLELKTEDDSVIIASGILGSMQLVGHGELLFSPPPSPQVIDEAAGTALAITVFPLPGDSWHSIVKDKVNKGRVELEVWLVPAGTKGDAIYKNVLSNRIRLTIKPKAESAAPPSSGTPGGPTSLRPTAAAIPSRGTPTAGLRSASGMAPRPS